MLVLGIGDRATNIEGAPAHLHRHQHQHPLPPAPTISCGGVDRLAKAVVLLISERMVHSKTYFVGIQRPIRGDAGGPARIWATWRVADVLV